jgi:ubiquinone/menaquinone biosynthesis C-methylase UbiE
MSNDIRSFFDTQVEEWDTQRYQDETYISRARVGVGFLTGGRRARRVLDIGCGTGHQSVQLLEHGNWVVSVDFSPQMAQATRERIRRTMPQVAPRVVVADATRPPFRAGSFDAVLALGLVGFIKDRVSLFGELRGLIRPGGDLVCDAGVPEREVLLQMVSRTLSQPITWVVNLKRALRGQPRYQQKPGWYSQNFIKHSPREFERLLQGSGFQPRQAGGAGFGELRIHDKSVLPWRVQNWLARHLSRLSSSRAGRFIARHALTYVVRSTRLEGESPARLAHAPAVRG